MNLEWFFQLPGLFITGGVVLIIIALIVFIVGSKSGNKELVNQEIDENTSEETVNDIPVEEPTITKLDNVSNMSTPEVNGNINDLNGVSINPQEPVMPSVEINPVAPEPVMPSVEINPVTPEPVMPSVEINPVTPEPQKSVTSNVEEI